LLPAGVWPHTCTTMPGTAVLFGPAPSDRFPLLSDAQLLGLLCEGSPEPRPRRERGGAWGVDRCRPRYLRLDAKHPAAPQRARQAAPQRPHLLLVAAGRRHRVHRPAGSVTVSPSAPVAGFRGTPVPQWPAAPHRGSRLRPSSPYVSILIAGERNVPSYRPLTRAEDAAPLAAGGPPPVAALPPAPAPGPGPAPAEVGLPAITMPQDPPPRRGHGRGRCGIRGGR
jgi:hypothetical protein